MLKTLSLIYILTVVVGMAFAQELIIEQHRDEVDFWLIMPYNNLNFRSNATSADYQISIQIRNSLNRQMLNLEKRINYQKRDWLVDCAIPLKFSQALSSGTYNAEVRIRNRSVGGRFNFRRQFTIGRDPVEHGLPFVIVNADGIEYMPASLNAIPSEFQSCRIEQKFSTFVDSVKISVGDKHLSIAYPRSPLVHEFDPSGGGRLELSFYELNIIYKMDAFLYSQWFTYGQKYTLREQIDQLRYIATQNEWQVLRNVPQSEYQKVIEQFWNLQDPSPGTLRNEARERFCQRVLIADERYTLHRRLKGWTSDRGRIFIKYGDPDEIVSEVHPLDAYPYLIWTYYHLNLEFIFADIGGFGQYTLRNPEDEY